MVRLAFLGLPARKVRKGRRDLRDRLARLGRQDHPVRRGIPVLQDLRVQEVRKVCKAFQAQRDRRGIPDPQVRKDRREQ